MTVGQPYILLISNGDPPGGGGGSPQAPADDSDHGFSGIPALGLAAQTLVAGAPPVVENITPTGSQVGAYAYSCNESECGSGHFDMIGAIIVSP